MTVARSRVPSAISGWSRPCAAMDASSRLSRLSPAGALRALRGLTSSALMGTSIDCMMLRPVLRRFGRASATRECRRLRAADPAAAKVPRQGGPLAIPCRPAPAPLGPDQDDVRGPGHDFGPPPPLRELVDPAVGLQPALDVDDPALGQVLGDAPRPGARPDGHLVPDCLVGPLAVGALAAAVGGEREPGHDPVADLARLGVAPSRPNRNTWLTDFISLSYA